METSHRIVAAICPKSGCEQAIHVSIGRWPGGLNDKGGFVIECANCGSKSYIRVSNPDDASSVTSGGRVVATWDDDVDQLNDVLQSHGLTVQDELRENILVLPSDEPDSHLFVLEDRAT